MQFDRIYKLAMIKMAAANRNREHEGQLISNKTKSQQIRDNASNYVGTALNDFFRSGANAVGHYLPGADKIYDAYNSDKSIENAAADAAGGLYNRLGRKVYHGVGKMLPGAVKSRIQPYAQDAKNILRYRKPNDANRIEALPDVFKVKEYKDPNKMRVGSLEELQMMQEKAWEKNPNAYFALQRGNYNIKDLPNADKLDAMAVQEAKGNVYDRYRALGYTDREIANWILDQKYRAALVSTTGKNKWAPDENIDWNNFTDRLGAYDQFLANHDPRRSGAAGWSPEAQSQMLNQFQGDRGAQFGQTVATSPQTTPFAPTTIPNNPYVRSPFTGNNVYTTPGGTPAPKPEPIPGPATAGTYQPGGLNDDLAAGINSASQPKRASMEPITYNMFKEAGIGHDLTHPFETGTRLIRDSARLAAKVPGASSTAKFVEKHIPGGDTVVNVARYLKDNPRNPAEGLSEPILALAMQPLLAGPLVPFGVSAGLAHNAYSDFKDWDKAQKEHKYQDWKEETAPERSKANLNSALLAGGVGSVGLYGLLNAVPVLRKNRIARAILALAGGGAIGYGAWKMSDNNQINNTNKSGE